MSISRNIKRSRRGSLAVETAIILPLFIIGIVTLAYLIKFTMAGEGAFHALADETDMYAAVYGVPLGSNIYEHDLTARAEKEGIGDVTEAEVRGLYSIPYLGKNGRFYTNLVGSSLTWTTPIKLPPLGRDSLDGQVTILVRSFVGSLESGPGMSFDEMERADAGGMVWVFPRAGERYHTQHCSVIENNPQERLLDRAVRSQYKACQLCGAVSAHDGDLVYCFPASGRVFHTGDCYLVERYVMEIDRADARKQGYTACMICGGGG